MAKRPSEFASLTVDFGIVVSDIAKAAAFYMALGFKEVPGFDVPAAMGRDSGLSDSKAFSVRIFALGDGDAATKVKIMQFAGAPGARTDTAFIHSTLGIRYLTVYVTDQTPVLARLKAVGVSPLAHGPYALPEGFPKGVFLSVVRDPDGNMIELVGPKK
jgi:catechol 2,3-dioxygenase-like lactoylglutathione lyase family enzyme